MIKSEEKTTGQVKITKEAEQEKKKQLLGKIMLKKGHSVFEFNRVTLEIKIAEQKELPYKYSLPIKTNNLAYFAEYNTQSRCEIVIKENCIYIPALNKKNVKKVLFRDYNINLSN